MSLALEAGGVPATVVTAATGTGVGSSTEFAVLAPIIGAVRHLWLSLGPTTGSGSALKVDLETSFDGGTTWNKQQAGIDLFNSPAQVCSPDPPPGAKCRLNVTTFTSFTTVNVVASSR